VEADHLALGRDDQDIVAVVQLQHGDDGAITAAVLMSMIPLPARPCTVLVERGPLAEARAQVQSGS